MSYKQVIVVRQDLKLPKGKACAQVAHASVEAVLRTDEEVVGKWRAEGMAKIVCKVGSLQQLVQVFQDAKDLGLPASLITDAGRTVIAPGTKTCVGIGPADEAAVDALTSTLSLL